MALAALSLFLTALKADASLVALVGSKESIRYGSLSESRRIPGVYLKGGMTDTSTPNAGAASTGHRTNDDTARVSVWASTPELAQELADRVDEVVLRGLPGLLGLVRSGGMAADSDPDEPELWHATATYSYVYRVADSIA